MRGTSHQKLYDESGLIPLKERRTRHKLIIFFKMVKGMAPRYLIDCLPPLVSSLNPYHRRNPLERSVPFCRTELFKQSFFPSTTCAWNNLSDVHKEANSVAQFKRFLSLTDISVPKLYYNSNRFVEIIHCKIRNEISDLNNDLFKRHLKTDGMCACGLGLENSKHYFLDCPFHTQARTQSILTIPNFASLTLKCLTHGDSNKTFVENKLVFDKVHQFIILSNRFH